MKGAQGGCMCGAIRYTLKNEPAVVYYCHCNDCKKSTGSAFHIGLVMKTSDVDLNIDKAKSFTKTADSGNQMTRYFCGDCGSPLFTKDSAAPDNLVIKAGSLDDMSQVNPIAQLWTIREVTCARIKPDIISLEKGKAFELEK